MEIQGRFPLQKPNLNFSIKAKEPGVKENKEQKSTDAFQKAEINNRLITPQNNEKTEYIKEHREAKLLGTDKEGNVHLSGVRWGFSETEKPENWNPRWKEISVNPSKIKDVYMVLELYPDSFPGHALTCFEFEDDGKVKTSDGESTKMLALSFEAHLKKDQAFDAAKGLKNEYGVIYQLGSWEDQVQKVCRRDGHSLLRFKLNMTQDQKEKLLKNSIEAAVKDRTGEYYHTTRNSCFNSQARLLNTVLPPHKQTHEWILPGKLYNPLLIMPRGMSPVLGFKGALDESAPVLTQPDKEKFPEQQVKPSLLRRALNKLGKIKGFSFFTGAAGAIAGAAAGSLVPLPVIGTIAGGVAGGIATYKIANWGIREGRMQFEEAGKYLK